MMALTKEQADAILNEHFAPWVLALGIKIDALTNETATLRIPFSSALCEAGGGICGPAVTAGADTAMVIALSRVDLSVNHMRAVAGGDAVLEAKVVRLGRSIAFCTADVRAAASGERAAVASATYVMPST